MFDESSTGNSFLLDRLSIRNFTWRFLRQLRENVRRKRPEMWRWGDWFLHHENVPAHTALSVTRYLATLRIDRRSPSTLFTGPSPLCFLFIPDDKKKHWKERDSTPRRRCKQLRRRHSTISSFSSSRDASHGGKKTGQVITFNGKYFEVY